MTGIDRIAAERATHESRGYTAEHDEGHAEDLLRAADAYIQHSINVVNNPWAAPETFAHPADVGCWPANWSRADWSPADPYRNLEKAGSLVAAAMDSMKPDAEEEVSEFKRRAINEMTIAGVDHDIYGDMTSKAVLELIDVFDKQGHSGMSAGLVLSIFTSLVNGKNLSPLTNDPTEWFQHSENNWQNRRNSSAFSMDGGLSYYLVGESHWKTNKETGQQYRAMTFYQTKVVDNPFTQPVTEAEEENTNGETAVGTDN